MVTIKSLFIGASVFASFGAIAHPAVAGSLTNVSISGTAPYLTYDANQTNTFKVDNTAANLTKVLSGNINSPTGNVELFSNSESLNNAAFKDYTGVTSLTGKIGGQDITLSSLTIADWNTSSSGKTLGQRWFDETLSANGFSNFVGTSSATLYSIFDQYGGLQRFSDPNISYVNQDNTTGLISIGLAGHLNATPLLLQSVDAFLIDPKVSKSSKLFVNSLRSMLAPAQIQASELVKYTYNNQIGYLYSFKGVKSNLVEKGDGVSHSATYEVSLQGIPPAKPKSVPEPSMLLGLIGLGGLFTAKRKAAQKA
jgi:hypothetical protein